MGRSSAAPVQDGQMNWAKAARGPGVWRDCYARMEVRTRHRFDPELPSLMANTMKALRKVQAARGLSLEKTVVPAIWPADGLVGRRTALILRTDLPIYGWDRWSQGRI